VTTSDAGGNLALLAALVGAVGLARQPNVPKALGNSKENLFKNAKGRPFYFVFSPTSFYQSKVQVVTRSFTCPRGKSLLKNCQSFFETEFLSGHIATNAGL
jgi:hypothetical protein